MATVYTGYHPILQGQNSNNWVGPKGKVGVYSNYSLRNTGNKIFTGAPDHEHVLGTYKHATILEYLFAGGQNVAPLANPGLGARLSYFRYHPLENKAAGNSKVFTSGYGHTAFRSVPYAQYSNFIFDGLTADNVLLGGGHVRRFNTTYGGAFDPLANKGVMPQALATTVDNPSPTGYNNPYGKNHTHVWLGVPSGRAL